MQVIKQVLVGSGDTQTIKQVVQASERGPKGETGETGAAATIEPGNAYSVPSDQAPAVINTGTSSDAVFDFYIPKGEKGDQGEPGVASFTMTSVDPGEGVPLGANQFIAVYKP